MKIYFKNFSKKIALLISIVFFSCDCFGMGLPGFPDDMVVYGCELPPFAELGKVSCCYEANWGQVIVSFDDKSLDMVISVLELRGYRLDWVLNSLLQHDIYGKRILKLSKVILFNEYKLTGCSIDLEVLRRRLISKLREKSLFCDEDVSNIDCRASDMPVIDLFSDEVVDRIISQLKFLFGFELDRKDFDALYFNRGQIFEIAKFILLKEYNLNGFLIDFEALRRRLIFRLLRELPADNVILGDWL